MFDEAFLYRFVFHGLYHLHGEITAIKYPELNASAKLAIWRNLFELADSSLWGSDPEGFVTLDGKEPRYYVSLSDPEAMAQKRFNG
jgi:hypothetical protein